MYDGRTGRTPETNERARSPEIEEIEMPRIIHKMERRKIIMETRRFVLLDTYGDCLLLDMDAIPRDKDVLLVSGVEEDAPKLDAEKTFKFLKEHGATDLEASVILSKCW